jgi:hypothetical protein
MTKKPLKMKILRDTGYSRLEEKFNIFIENNDITVCETHFYEDETYCKIVIIYYEH